MAPNPKQGMKRFYLLIGPVKLVSQHTGGMVPHTPIIILYQDFGQRGTYANVNSKVSFHDLLCQGGP